MADQRYPLYWPDGWKRTPPHKRERSRYHESSFARARDGLLDELRKLGARDVILSTNVELRQDGLPYSNRREPEDPGVAVYWTGKKGERCSMACDRWTKVTDNAHALELAVGALRLIQRSGASEILDRAFRGFTALNATNPARTWRDVMGFGLSTPTESQVTTRYRDLAYSRHPDRGGTHEAMAELNRAREEAMRELGGT